MPATISGILMNDARAAYIACIKDREYNLKTDDDNFSFHALTVYILAVTALEAFIKEVYLNPFFKLYERSNIPRDKFERMELGDKYCELPRSVWGNTFECGSRPFQDFDALVKLRNDIVHYTMDSYSFKKLPKYREWLRSRNILFTVNKPGEGVFGWVEEFCCAKAALWAYNTGCQMANRLIEFSDSKHKDFWRGYLSSTFCKIADDHWKTIIITSE